MHFKIDKNDLISEFHIERWDRQAMGEYMCEKIEKYKNKDWKDFIFFALKNELFLKLRSLFSLGEKTIYFWTCAPAYGESEKDGVKIILEAGKSRDVNLKYAKINLEGKSDKKLISVLREAGLSDLFEKYGREAEDITFKCGKEELIKISLAFNVSRNNDNSFYLLSSKQGNNEEYLRAVIDDLVFSIMKKDNEGMIIINEKDLINITSDEEKEFTSILPMFTDDKEKQRRIREILQKMKQNSNINKKINNKKWWKFGKTFFIIMVILITYLHIT